MAHRLFHSLVLSSVLALDAVGCTIVHTPAADAGGPDPDGDAGGPDRPDAAFRRDAGRRAVDSGRPDAGLPDAGHDAGVADAGVEDSRFCEPGWPTTKATICVTIDGGTDVECCNALWLPDGSVRHENCCIGRVD